MIELAAIFVSLSDHIYGAEEKVALLDKRSIRTLHAVFFLSVVPISFRTETYKDILMGF